MKCKNCYSEVFEPLPMNCPVCGSRLVSEVNGQTVYEVIGDENGKPGEPAKKGGKSAGKAAGSALLGKAGIIALACVVVLAAVVIGVACRRNLAALFMGEARYYVMREKETVTDLYDEAKEFVTDRTGDLRFTDSGTLTTKIENSDSLKGSGIDDLAEVFGSNSFEYNLLLDTKKNKGSGSLIVRRDGVNNLDTTVSVDNGSVYGRVMSEDADASFAKVNDAKDYKAYIKELTGMTPKEIDKWVEEYVRVIVDEIPRDAITKDRESLGSDGKNYRTVTFSINKKTAAQMFKAVAKKVRTDTRFMDVVTAFNAYLHDMFDENSTFGQFFTAEEREQLLREFDTIVEDIDQETSDFAMTIEEMADEIDFSGSIDYTVYYTAKREIAARKLKAGESKIFLATFEDKNGSHLEFSYKESGSELLAFTGVFKEERSGYSGKATAELQGEKLFTLTYNLVEKGDGSVKFSSEPLNTEASLSYAATGRKVEGTVKLTLQGEQLVKGSFTLAKSGDNTVSLKLGPDESVQLRSSFVTGRNKANGTAKLTADDTELVKATFDLRKRGENRITATIGGDEGAKLTINAKTTKKGISGTANVTAGKADEEGQTVNVEFDLKKAEYADAEIVVGSVSVVSTDALGNTSELTINSDVKKGKLTASAVISEKIGEDYFKITLNLENNYSDKAKVSDIKIDKDVVPEQQDAEALRAAFEVFAEGLSSAFGSDESKLPRDPFADIYEPLY